MTKKWILVFICFTLLSACSKNGSAIIKKDSPPTDPNENPELIEEENEDEVSEFIEFALPNEEVMINLEMVPILNSYLEATADREKAIKNMNMLQIQAENSEMYLLEFSCHNDFCSYLLLDQSKDNQAILVADLAKSIQSKLSPDKSKLFLQFNRATKLPLPLTDIVVIDLEQWKPLQLTNKTDDRQVLDYNWPIITAEWMDNQKIRASLPDIAEPVSDIIQEWQQSGKKTTTIELDISSN
ncbi:hypothetical protein [Lentibacillus sp. Marseille-P4043]|uniref:hypothetical protein n=1 Tax=Lentibacillus sp. Marseille-P4043 TaxID=2040293 RepID=UPI000D0B7A84|nr:hypothetical protein [Lentibacillus sp. Marseille-P4043]